MSESELKRRYRWQCRRGLLEVDVVLNDYMERVFDDETEVHQLLFGRLLASQDADLFEWFTRRSAPDDQELSEYVEHILTRLRQLGRLTDLPVSRYPLLLWVLALLLAALAIARADIALPWVLLAAIFTAGHGVSRMAPSRPGQCLLVRLGQGGVPASGWQFAGSAMATAGGAGTLVDQHRLSRPLAAALDRSVSGSA
jgi:antitoxin CptB